MPSEVINLINIIKYNNYTHANDDLLYKLVPEQNFHQNKIAVTCMATPNESKWFLCRCFEHLMRVRRLIKFNDLKVILWKVSIFQLTTEAISFWSRHQLTATTIESPYNYNTVELANQDTIASLHILHTYSYISHDPKWCFII